MIIAAEFSQVSAAQLSALWEGIYSIMLSDIEVSGAVVTQTEED